MEYSDWWAAIRDHIRKLHDSEDKPCEPRLRESTDSGPLDAGDAYNEVRQRSVPIILHAAVLYIIFSTKK